MEPGIKTPFNLRFGILASLLAALTAVGAFIKIPIPYVPLTLQTFFVILSGTLLGPGYGALSQLIYLTVGLIGIPVFANGGGPGYVLQPTFGYLLSYPLAAFVIGHLVWGSLRAERESPPGFWLIIGATSVGMIIIYILGISVLYWNLNVVVGQKTSFISALKIGFWPFLPGTLVKLLVNGFLARKLLRVIGS